MSENPKIHVFLGAPPPSGPAPGSVSEAGVEDEEEPPGRWRSLELCWRGGRLRRTPADGVSHRGFDRSGGTSSEEAGQIPPSGFRRQDQARSSEETGTYQENINADRSTQMMPGQEDQLHADQEDLSSTADQTVETLQDQDGQSRSDCKLNADHDDLCSASIHEYLDSCFPAAQPEPEPEVEPAPGRSKPSMSVQTQYLTTWTLSQALILRGRHGVQSGPSPEKTPPPQTPPNHTRAPLSISSSTPELFSPATPTQSPRTTLLGSMELFNEPFLSQKMEEGGVVLEATPDGMLCSQGGEHQELGGIELSESKLTPPSQISQTSQTAQTIQTSQTSRTSETFQTAQTSRTSETFQTAQTSRTSETFQTTQTPRTSETFQTTQTSRTSETFQTAQTSRTSETFQTAQTVQTSQTSPSKSPDHKRARTSETSPAPPGRASVGLQGPTTLLVRCDKPGVRYSVLVAVVHPCHLKEIQVKSGASAGTFIPLASIVVTDQSDVEMKVVLWRQAAFWALTVCPGDLLLITGLEVHQDRWRGETVLQSTYISRLLNLGRIKSTTTPAAPQRVNGRTLASLCGFLRARRPLLAALPPRVAQNPNCLPYVPLRSLRVNTLVNVLLRITHTSMAKEWRSEAHGSSRSAVVLKAVLTVEQPDGHQGAMVLWGAALDWLPRFSRNRAAVWDFHVLLVRYGLTSDLPELHSTPWSSAQHLDPADRRALDFYRAKPVRTSSTSLELDLHTLLSQKYSGEVELRVHITAFQFQASPSQNAPEQVLDNSTPLDRILEVLSGDITYTGCGRCGVELDTDANGIYDPCYPCLPHTAICRHYRAGVLTVGEGDSQVCVHVPPVLLQKILNTPPDKLYKTSAPGSEVKNIHLVAERIQTLLFLPRKTFILTVRSHFLCDENSIPTAQDFLLLDLQFPAD
ncbi:shieldin complex subunit 2 [Diretmus argenteus]